MLLSLYKSTMSATTMLLERYLQKRLRLGKEDADRTHERRGRPAVPRPPGTLIWLHAASVGESLSLLSVVQHLRGAYPDVQMMMTTGTVSSAKLMAARLPDGVIHQYMPVDHPKWVAQFLDHWQPSLAIWTESEFWPNMLMEIQRRNIPALLLNARMSDTSFKRWKFFKGAARHLLKTFSVCLTQSDAETEMLKILGAANVRTAANLKYAAAPLPFDERKMAALKDTVGSRPCVLWASTHPGEERIAARTHAALKSIYPEILTIIVPRHPNRAPDIIEELKDFTLSRRSEGVLPQETDDIYLADTMGELGLFYRLTTPVVIGGSFAKIGGHNPIEAAQCNCVIFYGPQMFNFKTICKEFETPNAALSVRDEKEMTEKLLQYLANPSAFEDMAEAAFKLTQDKANILDDILALCDPYLKKARKRA